MHQLCCESVPWGGGSAETSPLTNVRAPRRLARAGRSGKPAPEQSDRRQRPVRSALRAHALPIAPPVSSAGGGGTVSRYRSTTFTCTHRPAPLALTAHREATSTASSSSMSPMNGEGGLQGSNPVVSSMIVKDCSADLALVMGNVSAFREERPHGSASYM